MRMEVLINAAAGGPAEGGEANRLHDLFVQQGIDANVHLVRGESIDDAVRDAFSHEPDAIVVGGGDGTINAVAARLVGTGMPLGVLPLGTYNHFAKDLHVPLDLSEA